MRSGTGAEPLSFWHHQQALTRVSSEQINSTKHVRLDKTGHFPKTFRFQNISSWAQNMPYIMLWDYIYTQQTQASDFPERQMKTGKLQRRSSYFYYFLLFCCCGSWQEHWSLVSSWFSQRWSCPMESDGHAKVNEFWEAIMEFILCFGLHRWVSQQGNGNSTYGGTARW